MDTKKPKNKAPALGFQIEFEPMKEAQAPEVQIEIERMIAVCEWLKQGDIAECKTGDVKHVAKLLDQLIELEDLAPGALAELLSMLLPLYRQLAARMEFFHAEQKMADAAGVGDEYRAMQKARKLGKKIEARKAWIELHMKAYGWSKTVAEREYATRSGISEETVHRTVSRHKQAERERGKK